ncbi:MAG: HAD hydrolase family protein [Draconibacterium sp.]
MDLPKLILTDIDGVWTDGGMYYSEDGNEWKKFNTSDSAGVLFFHLLGVPVGIITGEDTNIVKNRAKKLKIDILKSGVKNKLAEVKRLAAEMNIRLNEIAYIGDDINDIQVLKNVGFSAVPFGTPDYVSDNATLILNKKGGDGAFREFSEYILIECNLLNVALEKYNNEIIDNY